MCARHRVVVSASRFARRKERPMHTMRLALAGLLTTLLAGAVAAHAAEITVTMKDDVVADDGRCSLREAIDAANTDSRSGRKAGECIAGQRVPVIDVIQLRRGTYRLKRGGPATT
jgi:CSLREA domain-containing protein